MNMNASVRTGRARPTVQFCTVERARRVRTEAFMFICSEGGSQAIIITGPAVLPFVQVVDSVSDEAHEDVVGQGPLVGILH